MTCRDSELDERDDNEMATGEYFRRIAKIAKEECEAARAYNTMPEAKIEKLHKEIDALRHMHYDQGIDIDDQVAALNARIKTLDQEYQSKLAAESAARALEDEWDYETTKTRKQAYNDAIHNARRPCDRSDQGIRNKLGFWPRILIDNARRHGLTNK